MLLIAHVAISLYALLSGVFVVVGLLKSQRLPLWTASFLTATIATSASGYLFHSRTFGPPHVIGVISLAALAIAVFALYVRGLAGPWRVTYVTTAVFAFYLNAFVGVVQAFDKIAFLHAFAPTGSGPVFALAQAGLCAVFFLIGWRGVKRFRPEPRARVVGVGALE